MSQIAIDSACWSRGYHNTYPGSPYTWKTFCRDCGYWPGSDVPHYQLHLINRYKCSGPFCEKKTYEAWAKKWHTKKRLSKKIRKS